MWTKIKQFADLLSIVVEFVRVLIPAVEVPGWGPEKRKLVLDIVEHILGLVEKHFIPLPLDKKIFLDVAGWLIDIYVAFFNKVGEFVNSANAMLIDSGLKTK